MRLDERVPVLEASVSQDEYGEETVTYSERAKVWAQVDEQMPTRARAGSEPEGQGAVTIRLRTLDADEYDVGTGTRLRWDGDVLRVQGRTSDPQRNGFEQLRTQRVT